MVKMYAIGGSVRDKLIDPTSKPKDLDFAVVASSYEAMKEEILSRGGTIYQEKPEFFTIKAKIPNLGNADFVLARKEGPYSDGRRPDFVEVGTLLDDLSRREFTICAIAQDTETGEIIDPFDGQKDIQNKLLRCVGNTRDRFTEDSLRLIRAMRFHITKGFFLHGDIQMALQNRNLIDLLDNISVERIYEELRKCFEHDTRATFIFLTNHWRLRDHIFDRGIRLIPKF